MSIIPLTSMSAATTLTGSELFYAQQGGANVKVTASQIFGNYLGAYTVALLPAAPATWSTATASDGRKVGEGPGSGTGCPVYFQSVWRVFSSDQPVAS